MRKIKILVFSLSLSAILASCQCQRQVDNEPSLKKIKTVIEAAKNGQEASLDDVLDALFLAGKRQDETLADEIIALLKSTTDLSIGNACIGALSNMTGRKIMPAIIEYVERKPPIIRRQAIIAARKIADQQALEWLLVMAYGHDDERVRQEALEAYKEVENKIKPAS